MQTVYNTVIGDTVLFVFLIIRAWGKFDYTVKMANLEEDALYRFSVDGKEQWDLI